MGVIKAIKLSQGEVNAYLQLPAGVHTIADKKYTVSERVYNQGMENEWKTTVIDLIEPVATVEETPVE